MPRQYRGLEVSWHRATFARGLIHKDVGEAAFARNLFGTEVLHGETDDDAGITHPLRGNLDLKRVTGDTLEVEVAAERVGNSSIVIGFTMQNLRTEEVAGKGSFTYVFVDKATRKSCPMPADFKASVLARHPELA